MIIPRSVQFWLLLIGLPLFTFGMLVLAQLGLPHAERCSFQFVKGLGCLLRTHENLAGGLIGGAGALFGAWVAFISIQDQILESRRAKAESEIEAKRAAELLLAHPVQIAALIGGWVLKSQLATNPVDQQRCNDAIARIVITLKATLEFRPLIDVVQDLSTDDRSLYIAVSMRLLQFVNVVMNPVKELDNVTRMNSHKAILRDVHTYLERFSPILAATYARDSGGIQE